MFFAYLLGASLVNLSQRVLGLLSVGPSDKDDNLAIITLTGVDTADGLLPIARRNLPLFFDFGLRRGSWGF